MLRNLPEDIRYDSMESRLIKYTAQNIEGEIVEIIHGTALPVVDQMLRISDDYESRAFFLKLYGDLKRYLCEIAREDEKQELVEETKAIYDQAMHESENLFSTHPLRLATALNCSVFLAEVAHDLNTASDIAKASFEAALFDLQAIGEDKMHETLRVMQLLKDNVTLWGLDLQMVRNKQKAAGRIVDEQAGDDADRPTEIQQTKVGLSSAAKPNMVLAGGDIMPTGPRSQGDFL